jgi:hypothetical protein
LPAYHYPPAPVPRVAATRRMSHRAVLSGLFGGLAGVVVILIVIALLSRSAPGATCVGLTCQVHPPVGPPVQTGTLYTNPQFKFTARELENPVLGIAPTVSTANGDLTLSYSSGGTQIGFVQLEGVSDSNGQTAEQIVESVINKATGGQAQTAYTIPGSMIGYQPGFGQAYNFTPNTGDGQSGEDRVLVMASIQNGVAIVAVAAGPFTQFGDGSNQINDGHPSIADTVMAEAADPVINSVLWPGQTTP